MARYYELKPSTFAEDFAAALLDYYGDGVTIESASGTTIIFECPAICDKALKFATRYAGFSGHYRDDAGSMVEFATSYNGSNSTGFHLILADAFLLMESQIIADAATSAVVGKLTNGRSLVSSGIYYSTSISSISGNRSIFTDEGVGKAVCIVSPYAYDLKHDGKLCLWPAFIACEGEMEVNEDGTFAKIPGLYVTSSTSQEMTVGSNFYLSKGPITSLPNTYRACNTRKYVELEVSV